MQSSTECEKTEDAYKHDSLHRIKLDSLKCHLDVEKIQTLTVTEMKGQMRAWGLDFNNKNHNKKFGGRWMSCHITGLGEVQQ